MLFTSRILTVTLILPHISAHVAKCYYPDTSQDNNDVPCFADDASSRCCAPDEVCSTNKLCVSVKNGVNTFARRSCLDASFGGTCPDFCKGTTDSEKVEVYQCGDPALGQFCCDEGGGSSCCSKQSNIILLGRGINFGGGAPTTIMASMSAAPLSIVSKTTTSRGFVTSIISQHSTAPRPSASIVPLSSVSSQTRSSSTRLVSSQPQVSFSEIATTLAGEFTNLPSPVFTSIVVPTSTLPTQKTTTSHKTTLTTASIVLPSPTSSQTQITAQNQTTTTTNLLGTAASASSNPTESLTPAFKRLNSQAIIAGIIGSAVAVFLVAFFLILFRQQQKRAKALSAPATFFVDPKSKRSEKNGLASDKGSVRSMNTDDNMQTAFGYKPPPLLAAAQQPQARTQSRSQSEFQQQQQQQVQLQSELSMQRNISEGSNSNGGDISVPIVFRSDSRYDSSIRSADIRSIEERLQRMSDTTFSVGAATSASNDKNGRMTPGSDFSVFADPVEGTLRSDSRSGSSSNSRGSGMSRKGHRYKDSDSYIDERELSTFGYTPEDLNRVGGTGYGQRLRREGEMSMTMSVASGDVSDAGGRREEDNRSLQGMEGRLPARLSGLSERSLTYQKLLFDVQSKPF